MEETNTQIAWPSKLKIGAKSKKGILFCSFCGVGLDVKVVKPQNKQFCPQNINTGHLKYFNFSLLIL